MSETPIKPAKRLSPKSVLLGGVIIVGLGLGSGVLAQAVINNFDYGTLRIAQNLPSGKWKQVTRSSVVSANPGAMDREEIGCVTAEDVRLGLRGMAMNSLAFSGSSPGSCPVRVDRDTPNSAQVTSVCPSSITMIPINVPVTFTKVGSSQAYVVESCEVTPQGTKFVRSEFTYLGQCDGSAAGVRAIPRLTAPYRCGQASPTTPQAPRSVQKARPKMK